MKSNSNVILSLTDIGQALRRQRVLFYLAFIVFGCGAFFYSILKPIHYTATGIFNGHITHSNTPLIKALEFLGGEGAAFSADDQRYLLRSTPVLEGVVSALNLQAKLTEGQFGHRFREIWYTLKTAAAYKNLKKLQTPSLISGNEVYTLDHLLIPDQKSSITCADVVFPSETALSLKIVFLDTTRYKVFSKNTILGIGELEAPFEALFGSFTLKGRGKKGRVLGLHLIPLRAAAESLRHSLTVTKNKENSALIDISYTHRDRHLSAQIVNEVMDQIQKYLIFEGKKKIQKQLMYLQQRQEEIMVELEEKLEKQKMRLESDLDSGIIITFEKELKFMAEQQAEKKETLLKLYEELQQLSQVLYNEPFENIMEKIISLKKEVKAITFESIRHIIDQHQHQLDLINLDNKRYDHCLEKLNDPQFDSSALVKILNDEILNHQFLDMQKLHHNLIDQKNWTLKEREQLKDELETEKKFISQQIALLQEGAALHEKILKEKIRALQENLLSLLFDRYLQTENTLQAIKKLASHFPQKWLNEQKLEFQTKLYGDMLESVTKMVEAKNIGYNIDYLMSSCLQTAIPSLLPDHPHILLRAFFGAIIGVVLLFLGICLHQIWIGPSASASNLSAQGFTVITHNESIKKLGLTLSKGGKLILWASKKNKSSFLPLIDWLTKRGEKIHLIDLTTSSTLPAYQEKEEAYLASSSFHQLIQDLKTEYDRIVLLSESLPDSVQTQILISSVDSIVYTITSERLADIETLPQTTLFFIKITQPNILTLKAIRPLLTKIFRETKQTSFISVKSALNRIYAKLVKPLG